MKIHKEGIITIIITLAFLIIINVISYKFIHLNYVFYPLLVLSFAFLYLILHFFRKPERVPEINGNQILAPADGKLVTIEEIFEDEYFNDKRKLVSIFMSPLNVHINWYPISGKVEYYKYHKGKHLVAFSPKSSTDNERTTTVIKTEDNKKILIRQIAGAVARRVVCYSSKDKNVEQGTELGFIKFGSRVDIILPLDTNIHVKLDQKIMGNKTVIAELA